MEPRNEAAVGGLTASIAMFSTIAHTVYPILTFIAILTAAILGCHGVFCLLVDWHRKQTARQKLVDDAALAAAELVKNTAIAVADVAAAKTLQISDTTAATIIPPI